MTGARPSSLLKKAYMPSACCQDAVVIVALDPLADFSRAARLSPRRSLASDVFLTRLEISFLAHS